MKKLISCVLALVLMLSLAPSALAAGSPRVVLSSQNLKVNGEVITGLEIYNIDGSNYFKLRDVAYLLNGTDSQFNVTWDAENNAVLFILHSPYETVGGECQFNGVDKSSLAVPSKQRFLHKCSPHESSVWDAYIESYNIGGNNYVKLRDLFLYVTGTVDWDSSTNTVIVKSLHYYPSPEDMFDEILDYHKRTSKRGYDAAVALHDEMWATGKITSSSNQRQIAGVYYQWLDSNVRFRYDGLTDLDARFASAALIDKSAVSNGFTNAYQLLLTLEGIPCYFCGAGFGGHSWNKAILDGRAVYIDVTNEIGCFAESGMMSDTHGWQYDDAEYMMAELERCEAWLGWKF